MNINIEIKAICNYPLQVREILLAHGADYIGTDVQEDTYFNCREGRLKLRIGLIETNLIFYKRPDLPGLKQSDFKLVRLEDASALNEVLTIALGVTKVVRKSREIYYIGNVKFHIDTLAGLGSFVEIEAGNILADKSVDELRAQCEFYTLLLGITPNDLLTQSYSDMI